MNPYVVAFQVLIVLPVFLYMTFRLLNLKKRIEFYEDYLILRSIHLFSKVARIPKANIVGAEWFPFETIDDKQNGLRVFLSDDFEPMNFSGDRNRTGSYLYYSLLK